MAVHPIIDIFWWTDQPLVWLKSRKFPFTPWNRNHVVRLHKLMWTFWCVAFPFPFLSFFHKVFIHVSLVLKPLNYSRFDIFFFQTQISPGWRLHEHPLKRTKPNFGTNKAMASSTWRGWSRNIGCTQTFFRCHNRVLGDVLSVWFWQSLCVRCPHVKVTSEHSDDTLEWLSHVPWIGLDELYRQMRMCQETLRCCTTTLDSNPIVF